MPVRVGSRQPSPLTTPRARSRVSFECEGELEVNGDSADAEWWGVGCGMN